MGFIQGMPSVQISLSTDDKFQAKTGEIPHGGYLWVIPKIIKG